jgi:hypothetical protein
MGKTAMTSVTVLDETTRGEELNSFALELPEPTLTVRELIRARVHEEVRAHNESRPDRFLGLVQPTDTERDLNGYRFRKRRPVNWTKQAEVALAAFESNGFILLVNDRQVESLDEQVRVDPGSRITFLKLVPLVGG